MSDYGARYTDKRIRETDEQIRRTYRTAQRELKAKLADFNARFAKQDEKRRQMVADGKMSKQEYKDWLTGQVFMRNQWKSQIREVSQVLLHSNQQAANVINNGRLDVFAENYNFMAFRGEGSTGISFGIYSTEAVARLIADDPQILPEWKIDEEKDYEWNAKKVNNIVQQGIIQGEGVKEITDRLCTDLCTQNENKMRMFARTAYTGAQNAGRQQQMNDAADMGLDVAKQWLATLDKRTRDSHRMMDGEEVPYNEDFSNGLEYPGDPDGDPAEVYNCRCTMVTIYPNYDDRSKPSWREEEEIDGQSYEEWKANAPLVIPEGNRGLRLINRRIEKVKKQLDEWDDSRFASHMKSYNAFEEKRKQLELLYKKRAGLKYADDDVMKGYPHIDGEHTPQKDILATNPKFYSKDNAYRLNCQRCVPAYEMRRRGYDVVAKPRIMSGVDIAARKWEDIFEKAKWIGCPSGASQLTERMMRWGDGARAEVYVVWNNGDGAHVFVAENVKGSVIYRDPQTGETVKTGWEKDIVSGETAICRLDKLKPSALIHDCCEVRK